MTQVQYHVFTDQPDQVPAVEIAAGRELFVWPAENKNRWQDIGAGRFKVIANFIETELRDRADYIFCFDVDSKFHVSREFHVSRDTGRCDTPRFPPRQHQA